MPFGPSTTREVIRLFKKSRLLKIALAVPAAFFVLGIGVFFYFTSGLPSLNSLSDYHPNIVTTVYSADGRKIGEFYVERRIIVPLKKMPAHLINAFLAAEDTGFYEHEGVSYSSIFRALYKNIQAGRIVQGGSTITQQVARSFFLSSERKISRKIREAIMAVRIEKRLNKEEILNLYLNQIYLGNGAYGVQSAAETYFAKDVDELSIAESALLASLPKAPSKYSPYVNFALAKKRQEFVIYRMLEEHYITPEQADEALSSELELSPKKIDSLWVGPYFTEHVRRYVEETYGDEALYRGGLSIYTTLSVEAQKAANEALDRGLRQYDKRRGFRGPVAKLTTEEETGRFIKESAKRLKKRPLKQGRVYDGLITSIDPRFRTLGIEIGDVSGFIGYRDMAWAELYNPTDDPDGGRRVKLSEILDVGDVVKVRVKSVPMDPAFPVPLELTQEPKAEAALLAMETSTGFVRAMVGGSNFTRTQFNRAIQAYRQPGSAFKPIIYTAAIDKSYTPATVVVDSPLVYEDAEKEEKWRPRNYEEKFYGPTTVRNALAKSRNVVTIKILQDIGIPYAISYAAKLGISSPLSPDLSLALGSSALTLKEMVTAFATLDNMGKRPEPIFITKIVDRYGNVLEENAPSSTQVISPQTAYIMTSLLQGVVEHGTGWRARALGRPAAGKTGTTNNLNDAWFIGYVPGLVAGSWVGYDDEKQLGAHETGSRAALPIWLRFMKTVTQDTPVENFRVPDGIEFVKIDPETGRAATFDTKDPVFEVFKEGTAPAPGSAVTDIGDEPPAEDFFMLDTGPRPEAGEGAAAPDEERAPLVQETPEDTDI